MFIQTDDDKLVNYDHISEVRFSDESDRSVATLHTKDGTALGILTAANREDLMVRFAEVTEGPDFAGALARDAAARDVFGEDGDKMVARLQGQATARIIERYGDTITVEQAATLCVEVFMERMQFHVYSRWREKIDAEMTRKQSLN